MLRLNHGDSAGPKGQNTRIAGRRKGRVRVVLGAALALFMCALTTPALQASTPALAHKHVDCDGYFDSVFGALDQLDQAWAFYESTGESPLMNLVGEGYVAWAAGNVESAQDALDACLNG